MGLLFPARVRNFSGNVTNIGKWLASGDTAAAIIKYDRINANLALHSKWYYGKAILTLTQTLARSRQCKQRLKTTDPRVDNAPSRKGADDARKPEYRI